MGVKGQILEKSPRCLIVLLEARKLYTRVTMSFNNLFNEVCRTEESNFGFIGTGQQKVAVHTHFIISKTGLKFS